MGVRREPRTIDLYTKPVQLIVREATLEIRARVDSGRAMALDVEQVSTLRMVGALEKVVKAHLVEGRRALKTGNVASEPGRLPVRLHDHRHGVPTNDRPDPVLQTGFAGHRRLLVALNRIEVGGRRRIGQTRTAAPRLVDQAFDQIAAAFYPVRPEYGLQGRQPFRGFFGVYVGIMVDHQTSPANTFRARGGGSRAYESGSQSTRGRMHRMSVWKTNKSNRKSNAPEARLPSNLGLDRPPHGCFKK